jgi:hypothetical protein
VTILVVRLTETTNVVNRKNAKPASSLCQWGRGHQPGAEVSLEGALEAIVGSKRNRQNKRECGKSQGGTGARLFESLSLGR